MSQAGYTPLRLYSSATAAAVPSSGNLAFGELALNYNDMKLYAKNSAGVVTLLTSAGTAATYVDYFPQTAPSYLQGRVWYDSTYESLSYYNGTTSSPVRMGLEIQLKVYNNTGTTIAANQAVYLASGGSGSTPYVALAIATSATTANVLGLTVTSIPTGQSGYVTTIGLFEGYNTSSFSAGDALYLSSSVAGALTASAPAQPNFAVRVGFVAYVNASGRLYLSKSNNYVVANQIIGQVTAAAGGTGLGTYAVGDTLYASATTPTFSKLTLGTANQIMNVNSGATAPQWTGLSSLIDTVFTASTQGTILYRGASSWTALAPGTAGFLLQTGGAGGNPSWTTAPSTGVTTFQTSLTGLTPSTATNGAVTLAGTLAATSGGTGLTSYAAGDLIYASATNTLSKIGIGSNTQVLTVVAGAPAWSASAVGVATITFGSTGLTPSTATNGAVTVAGTLGSGYGGTGFNTYAAGDLVYASATNTLSKLTVGSTGYVLTVNAGVPSWQPATGGVTTFSAGSTGLTPNTATAGVVTLAGTLNAANGGTGFASYTTGDLLYNASTGSTLAKLTVGSTNNILVVSGGIPTWTSTLTSPTINTPSLAGEVFSTTVAVTAGTNAQGQGALTSDYNIITTTSTNPSGATLPTATVGRRILVANKGTNPVNLYPATGAAIDAITANNPISLVVGAILEFDASSTTQWYSTANTPVSLANVTGTLANTLGGTGQSSAFTQYGVVYGSTTTALATTSAGTTTTVLHGNASGAPTFGAVSLTADVSGTLPQGNGGTGFATYTTGDILYSSSTNTLSKLGIGTNTYVLTVVAGVPAWAVSTGLTGASSALNTASPNATNNVSSITASGGTTNQFLALVPAGTGGLLAAVPDSGTTGGNVRGIRSVDLQMLRTNATMVASGSYSGILSGNNNQADGSFSVVLGGTYGTARTVIGALVSASAYNLGGTTAGAQQSVYYQMGIETTAVTSTRLTTDAAAASTTNIPTLNNNGVMYFKGKIVAGVTAAGNTRVWTIEGALKRGANAAATSLVTGSTTINVVAGDSGSSTWTVTVSADTTNGGLNVTVAGQAATTIRWNCKIETTEVSF
tara:strand:+ start:17315 stop:20569 length:3255 start_codon:yes stop_codon:yes gene_type:complete